MKVLVLDDGRGRAQTIKEAFRKKKIDAAVCSASSDFMTALCASNFETVYINAATWKKGRCIYEYFGAGTRLAEKPTVFYNVDEAFPSAIAGRQPLDGDRSFVQPSDIETVLDAL